MEKSDSDVSNYSDSESSDSSKSINDNIDPNTFFNNKELCHYKKIDRFFKKCSAENVNKMIEIIEGQSIISLRVLDWFVTKYSKKRIDCGSQKGVEIFDVRYSYKAQLKSYKKRYFDPFRRKKKFVYHFDASINKSINTTLGQLNFFKWAFDNNILVYVEKNLKLISKEMNQCNKDDKDKKKKKQKSDEVKKTSDKQKPKKQMKYVDNNSSDNLKISATKFTENNEVQIVLKFD